MSDVLVDVSQLDQLSRDIREHSRQTPAEAVKIVSKGALNVKNGWRQAWTGLSHAPALASAVTYDVTVRTASVEAEIGPDKGRRQGSLGNLIEFGSVKNAPHPGGAPALAREEPRFVQAVEQFAAGLL